MTEKAYEDVRIEGHLIDSLMLPQIWDDIMDLEGEFEVLSFDVGRTKNRQVGGRAARLRPRRRPPRRDPHRHHRARRRGGRPERRQARGRRRATASSRTRFYATTNMETHVRLDGEWVTVRNPEMDCGVRVDLASGIVETIAHERRAARASCTWSATAACACCRWSARRESQPFEFMASAVCVREAQGADHP